MAARDLAADEALPGTTPEAAGEAAAESVLSRAQRSPSSVSAIVANASDGAGGDVPGGRATPVLGAFVAASTSPRIDTANRNAVRQAVIVVETTKPAGDAASTIFGNAGTGAGPDLGGTTLVGPSTGSGAGRGYRSAEQVGAGQSTSSNGRRASRQEDLERTLDGRGLGTRGEPGSRERGRRPDHLAWAFAAFFQLIMSPDVV